MVGIVFFNGSKKMIIRVQLYTGLECDALYVHLSHILR